jgi:hypothetical protein
MVARYNLKSLLFPRVIERGHRWPLLGLCVILFRRRKPYVALSKALAACSLTKICKGELAFLRRFFFM